MIVFNSFSALKHANEVIHLALESRFNNVEIVDKYYQHSPLAARHFTNG